jgi:hypothetical protein
MKSDQPTTPFLRFQMIAIRRRREWASGDARRNLILPQTLDEVSGIL